MSSNPTNLASTYVRLRPDVTAELLTVDESFWQRIASGQLGSFRNEYLVTLHTFKAAWPMWEMHPNGDEIVCLLSGSVTFILEQPDGNIEMTLNKPGDYALVPKGTWHTAATSVESVMLFITAGEGTEHRAI